MSGDNTLWLVALSLGAALAFGLGFAIHESSKRDDAARIECIDQNKLWIKIGDDFTCVAEVRGL